MNICRVCGNSAGNDGICETCKVWEVIVEMASTGWDDNSREERRAIIETNTSLSSLRSRLALADKVVEAAELAKLGNCGCMACKDIRRAYEEG